MHDIELDYSGDRYQARVPDTLDLSERAALALNALGGTLDPNLRYLPYGLVRYASKTPFMAHWACADVTCNPKYGEGFPMMRLVSGSQQYAEAEVHNRATMLSTVEDGLYWDPWTADRPWRNAYAPHYYGEGKNEDFAVVGATGLLMRAMSAWDEMGADSGLNSLRAAMVEGMRRVAIERADYCYYPEKGGWGEPCTYPRSGWLNTDEPETETQGGEGSVTCYHGNQIYGAAQWYMLSGDGKALDLAARLTRFVMQPKFWGGVADPDMEHARAQGLKNHVAARLPDPPYTAGSELGHWYSHFHARAITLRGMLQYAWAAGDERVLEFVRRAYEFTLTQGLPRIGWINCYPGFGGAEGCSVGDLIALGIRLSDTGMGDYWDDVDAVVRNLLMEQQLVRADLLQQVADASPERAYDNAFPNQRNTEGAIARSLGTFAGVSQPDRIVEPSVMLCCTGNGVRGLYYAWEGAVREDGDCAQVNLLVNRAAKLLDVDSYLPYEGRVVIHNKHARRIAVRVPAWANRRQLRAAASGVARPLDWVGNYLIFEDLQPTDTITVEFPIRETTASYTAYANSPQEIVYTLTFRGSTLVDIAPRTHSPRDYPLYLRAEMRKDVAPMKAVTRFVPDRIIRRW